MKKVTAIKSAPITKEAEYKIPTDLKKMLGSNTKVEALWKDLTPISRRDFITWIEGAKQLETRARRIGITKDKLLTGKRRPCCYAVIPMNFYKALSGTKGAKDTWKTLTATEKRDFVSWTEGAKNKEEQGNRIMEACIKLAAGKRRA